MARRDVAEFAGELLGQAVDDVHRAVLAAGASDRHREVAAVARLVLRHAAAHEARDVGHQRRHVGVGLEETDDLGIAAGEVAQARLPVGVGERPRVEHEIGVTGDAAFETEGLEADRQPSGAALLDALVNDVTQGMHAQARGVDQQVGDRGDRLEQCAFHGHRLAQADVAAAHGMLAARFREAPQQLVLGCDQEEHLALQAAAFELIDQLRHAGDLGRGIARVEPDGGALVGGLGPAHSVGDERLQQRRRDIVDAVEAEVLEHVQGHALAGPGQPAEDDDAHASMVIHGALPLQVPRPRFHGAAYTRSARRPSAAW